MATRRHTPLVDLHVLHDLEDDFHDPSPARAFVRDFVDVWDNRYLRLSTAISNQDQSAALDAVLSIKISAVMVGAPRLATMATELEKTIRNDDLKSSNEILEAIYICGNQTMKELLTNYINRS